MTLVVEAEKFARYDLARARGVRNGLMVALLALCPIRLKNFAGLEIGSSFKEVDGSWWIALPGHLTKSRRPDERRVPALLNRCIELYLEQSQPLLLGSRPPTMRFGPTFRSVRMRPADGPSNGSATLSRIRSLADYTTAMFESSFRKRQPRNAH